MIGPRRRGGVERGDGVGQRHHQRDIQAPGLRQPIEQRTLVEADHLDHPVDRHSRAAEGERPVGLARHGENAEVHVRGGAPIEAHFRLARDAPQVRGREIEIVEAHGTLELVRARTGQEHDRGVGVDAFDARAVVRRRRREKLDDGGLIVGRHDLPPVIHQLDR